MNQHCEIIWFFYVNVWSKHVMILCSCWKNFLSCIHCFELLYFLVVLSLQELCIRLISIERLENLLLLSLELLKFYFCFGMGSELIESWQQLHLSPLWFQSRSSDGETERDRLLFNCLNTLVKLLRECNLIRDTKWTPEMNIIWGVWYSQK